MKPSLLLASLGSLLIATLISCTFWPRIGALPASSLIVEHRIAAAMEAAKVPGLSVAVVRGSSVVWSHAFGIRNVATGAPVDDGTVFEAASLGKPVFAYTVLRLASRGIIQLDRPLFAYWVYPDIAGDERASRITAAMVLSHTSGIENWRGDDGLNLVADPGTSFNYSGEAFLFLQRVVERLTGRGIEEVVRKEVLEPYRMSRSFFLWNRESERDYAVGTDGAGNPVSKYKPTTANVAGGFHTTAGDYARFLIAAMQGRDLSPAIRKRMMKPAVKLSVGEGTDPDWVGWGLGFALQYSRGEGVALWHWGDNDVFKSYMVAFPAERTAIVYFADSVYGLSIRDEIVTAAVGGTHPAFSWVGYQQLQTRTHRERRAASASPHSVPAP